MVLNNKMPMACVMNASAPCDTSYGGWQAPMVAAVANGSATPVLQDDGAAWSAIGAGHDDVVLYDDACRAFAAAKKTVADVEDDAGFRAVAVLAGAAASAAGGAGVSARSARRRETPQHLNNGRWLRLERPPSERRTSRPFAKAPSRSAGTRTT